MMFWKHRRFKAINIFTIQSTNLLPVVITIDTTFVMLVCSSVCESNRSDDVWFGNESDIVLHQSLIFPSTFILKNGARLCCIGNIVY
jgi:hypothetical protein